MSATVIFLSGMTTMGFVVAALFFLNFWRRTQERLFAVFGLSFLLLAINQAAVALSGIPRGEQAWMYGLRIAAFGLLIAAIVGKNAGNGKPGPP